MKWDTAHGQMDVSKCHIQASSSLSRSAHGVYWRSPAGNLLPVRRWIRRPVDAPTHRKFLSRSGTLEIQISVRRADRQEAEQLRLVRHGRKEPAMERNIPIGSQAEARFCTSETVDATGVGTGTSITHHVAMPPHRQRTLIRPNECLEMSLSSLKFAEPLGIRSLLAISGWRIVSWSKSETSAGRCTGTKNAS